MVQNLAAPEEHVKITCLVLLPFEDAFELVYKFGISPAVEKLNLQNKNTKKNISIELINLDDIVYVSGKKGLILDKIKSSDLIIADITKLRPNVMWELGYCDALGKNLLLISQSIDEIPYYLKHRDVFKYRFSEKGMTELTDEIIKNICHQFDTILKHNTSILRNMEIRGWFNNIDSTLFDIDETSLLSIFIKKELFMFSETIGQLKNAKFSFRKQIPNEDITKYFCNYLGQIIRHTGSFDTISCYEFWIEISNQGIDQEYLLINKDISDAVNKDIVDNTSDTNIKKPKIRRIFILDDSKDHIISSIKGLTFEESEAFRILLNRYYEINKKSNGAIETKVYLSKNYRSDLEHYKNIGILTKKNEVVSFAQEYDEGRNLIETKCVYYDTEWENTGNFGENKRLIDRYQHTFDRLWNSNEVVPLDPVHFDFKIPKIIVQHPKIDTNNQLSAPHRDGP